MHTAQVLFHGLERVFGGLEAAERVRHALFARHQVEVVGIRTLGIDAGQLGCAGAAKQ